MTKGEAIHRWFNGFGIPFYPASAVPDDAIFPWGTYELTVDTWEGGEVGITVNLWFHTSDEAQPNAKAQEISNAIGSGGVTIPCDGGFIWLKRGSPWCQSLHDETDANIKRRYINITAEYMTLN